PTSTTENAWSKNVAHSAEPTAEADRGRCPGFSSSNFLAGGPGSLAVALGYRGCKPQTSRNGEPQQAGRSACQIQQLQVRQRKTTGVRLPPACLRSARAWCSSLGLAPSRRTTFTDSYAGGSGSSARCWRA